MGDERIVIPSDKTARFDTKTGHIDVYYDPEKDEIRVMSDAKAGLQILPRAGNSFVMRLRSTE